MNDVIGHLALIERHILTLRIDGHFHSMPMSF